jgi:ankyrin repeat protein
MNETLLKSLECALKLENMEMFDAVMKPMANLKGEDRAQLLTTVALYARSAEFLQKVFQSDKDLAYKDENSNTLLHYAASSDSPEPVKFFIAKGLDLEAKGFRGATPLCIAARDTSNVQVVEALIEAGADLQIRAFGGETLLITAAGCNPNVCITKFFLDKGFKLDDRDEDGFTPLLNAAAWQENLDVISLLIDAGADPMDKDKHGNTMFHIASWNPSPNVARYIADVFLTSEHNDDGENCLDFALRHARTGEVLKVYLEQMREEHVMLASMNENLEILETLIQSGYPVNATDNDGMSAMMLAAKVQEDPSIIIMLVNHNAIWNNRDSKGRTVLHYAAANANPTIYDFMTRDDHFGKLVDMEDSQGHTAEYYRAHQDEF